MASLFVQWPFANDSRVWGCQCKPSTLVVVKEKKWMGPAAAPPPRHRQQTRRAAGPVAAPTPLIAKYDEWITHSTSLAAVGMGTPLLHMSPVGVVHRLAQDGFRDRRRRGPTTGVSQKKTGCPRAPCLCGWHPCLYVQRFGLGVGNHRTLIWPRSWRWLSIVHVVSAS